MKILKFIPVLMLFLMACEDKSHSKTLYEEVMVIHDEAMPKMIEVNKIKRKFVLIEKERSDSTVQYYIKLLDDADEYMMTWMAEFKVPSDAAKAESYLKSEKTKIQDVQDKINTAIHDATIYLDSLSKINQ